MIRGADIGPVGTNVSANATPSTNPSVSDSATAVHAEGLPVADVEEIPPPVRRRMAEVVALVGLWDAVRRR